MLRTIEDFKELLSKKKDFENSGNKDNLTQKDIEIISILTFMFNDDEHKKLDEILYLGNETTNIEKKRKKQFEIIQDIYLKKLMHYFMKDDLKNVLKFNAIIVFLLPFLISNNSLNVLYRALWADENDYFSKVIFQNFYTHKSHAPTEEEKNLKEFEKISRYDFIYKRVETYNEFEINHCMAYEFAKRKHPLLDMNELEYIKKSIYSILEQSANLNINEFINSKQHIYDDFLNNLSLKELLKQLQEGDFEELQQEFLKELQNTHNLLSSDNIDKLATHLKNKEVFTKFFKRFFKITKQAIKLNMDYVKTDYDIEQSDNRYKAKNNNYVENTYSFVGINTKTHTYKIEPILSTPPLYESKKWEVDLKINLALADDEILKYIQHVKKQLMSEEVTSVEHYNNDIKNLKFATSKDIIDYDKHKDKFKLQRSKLANMLFIYDCYLVGLSRKEILERFNNYQDPKLGTIDKNKYFQYLNYAKQLIEEEKYKGLVDATFSFDTNMLKI